MEGINLVESQHQFLQDLEGQGKSFNTVKNYRADLSIFNKFLTERSSPLIMKTFSLTQVQEYQAHLERNSTSSNSIRRRVQSLRLFFDFLVRTKGYPSNPVKQMPVAPKVLENPTPVPFKDILRLKGWLENRISQAQGLERLLTQRNLLMTVLIYEAGLKVSDLARLELDDILFDRKTGGARVLVRPPKREPYSIPLTAGAAATFSAYRAALEAAWAVGTPRFVLFNANAHKILAGSLSPRGTELFFEDIRHQLKIDVTARNLRQAAVFRWMCLRNSEGQVKEWLGVAPDYDLSLYLEVFRREKDPPLYLELPYA